MAVFNNILAGSSGQTTGGGPYEIERSLRFNSPDSAYLNRTPASAGNRKTWTWSGWVKFGQLTRLSTLFGVESPWTGVVVNGDFFAIGDAGVYWRQTSNFLRDPSAWYHLVCKVDMTQATSDDRVRLYINGVEATYASSSIPAQNTDTAINSVNAHNIGRIGPVSGRYFDGYLAEVHLIDGAALDPSSFGEFDTNGVWQPIAYAGSYGTNGFRLPFSDNSGTSSTTLGKDAAGSNNWTPNNFSVAAGSGNDSLVDVPVNGDQTDTGIGNEVRGNYATLNPLDNGGLTISNGNLDYVRPSNGYTAARATIGVTSGKWYWEQTIVGTPNAGIFAGISTGGVLPTYPGQTATSYGYSYDGDKYTNNTSSAYGASYTTGDVLGVAFDADNGTLTFYKNGSSQGTAFSGLTSGPYFPTFSAYLSSAGSNVNFGQRPFAYTAPSGYKALCTTNLAEPTIADGSTAMDVVTYTGTGSTQTISGLNFSPDLVWIKVRSVADHNILYDAIRGAKKQLYSNLTQAEETETQGLTSFNSDGFTLGGVHTVRGQTNDSGKTYAAWCWDAGSSTVSNTDGSITSSVRANASAGFSVVTYTSNSSSNQTVGHGLNAAPHLVLVKNRDDGGDPWAVYTKVTGKDKYLYLNTTASAQPLSEYWGSAEPTSTVFGVGAGLSNNRGTDDMVAYCFAPVEGYSAFGSYTGNGSDDGPFLYCGFRPRWFMTKGYGGAFPTSWFIWDTGSDSNPYNESSTILYADLTNPLNTHPSLGIDILSNGIKMKADVSGYGNYTGNNYVWAAFAEHPFQYARAR